MRLGRSIVIALLASSLGISAGSAAAAAPYQQTNLVSNIPGLGAITDPLLVNPWGVSESPTSPFWVSNQATSTATLYALTGPTNVSKVNIAPNGFVAIPNTVAGPQGPTGQVNNTNTASFQLVPGVPGSWSRFIFASLNGTISGWAGGPTALIKAETPDAVYTGLAIDSAGTRLYAANVAAGSIDVFDASFAPLSVPGGFVDPILPSGFTPFNVQDIGGTLYVAYAPGGPPNVQRNATPGQGIIDAFDEQGNLLRRVHTGGPLASPWGMALAPAAFGLFGGDLLVGNFSFLASEINAFDPVTGVFEGTINVDPGAGNVPGGLWALMFGNGGNGGDPNTLYFTDGINHEADGLFAALTVVQAAAPEPSSTALTFAALGLLWWRATRKPRAPTRCRG